MTTLIDHLRALLGGNSLATEIALLTAADARASRLTREHGVLYSDAIHAAIDELTHPHQRWPGAELPSRVVERPFTGMAERQIR
jgi:hypothetical protein